MILEQYYNMYMYVCIGDVRMCTMYMVHMSVFAIHFLRVHFFSAAFRVVLLVRSLLIAVARPFATLKRKSLVAGLDVSPTRSLQGKEMRGI